MGRKKETKRSSESSGKREKERNETKGKRNSNGI